MSVHALSGGLAVRRVDESGRAMPSGAPASRFDCRKVLSLDASDSGVECRRALSSGLIGSDEKSPPPPAPPELSLRKKLLVSGSSGNKLSKEVSVCEYTSAVQAKMEYRRTDRMMNRMLIVTK